MLIIEWLSLFLVGFAIGYAISPVTSFIKVAIGKLDSYLRARRNQNGQPI